MVGGGIAGVCCAEELCRLAPDDQITLLSSDTVLKVRELLLAKLTSAVYHVSSSHSIGSRWQVRLPLRAATFLLGSGLSLSRRCYSPERILNALQGIGKVLRLTDHLEELEVVQRDLTSPAYPNLHVLQDAAAALDVHNKVCAACHLHRPAAQFTRLLDANLCVNCRLVACNADNHRQPVRVLTNTTSILRVCSAGAGI